MEMIVQYLSTTPSVQKAKHNHIHHMLQLQLWTGMDGSQGLTEVLPGPDPGYDR